MLTGMPVSISLGLTVLTFMFTLTEVPTESVALKLFTGIESFEIMAIPFFILAGTFLTHGGVARRMINFATSMVGHWYGGLGLAGVVACALFAAVSGSSPATVVAIGSVMMPAMVAQGFPQAFRRRRHHHLGRARHPDPAVDRDGAVRGRHQFLDGQAVHRRHRSRHRAGDDARRHHLVPRLAQRLPAHGAGQLAFTARCIAFRESVWGLLLIVIVIGGIYTGLFTPTEAAAMSAVYAFFIAVFVYKDMKLSDVPKRAAVVGEYERDAALHHHQRDAVLVPADQREYSAGAGATGSSTRDWAGSASCWWSTCMLLLAGNVMEPSSIIADHGADSVSGGDQARHRSDPLRHPDDGQHGGRPVPPAGRPQSLRRLGHRQDGHHRADHRGVRRGC